MKARCFLNGFLVKFERYLNQEYSRVMKKLLLPLLVSLILTSSFSNAEITSYDKP